MGAVKEYLPKLKGRLEKRNGRVLFRPDSGNPVDIVCGLRHADTDLEHAAEFFQRKAVNTFGPGLEPGNKFDFRYCNEVEGKTVECSGTVYRAMDGSLSVDMSEFHISEMTVEHKGVVRIMWDIVGGKVNSKGYKIMDEHFGVIYGDAITLITGNEMYSGLAANGFAANNIVLGFGSYTYQYVTRDTFGFALKVTHGILDGVEVEMFKDPITDHGSHSAGKTSQKGMCIVRMGEDGRATYTDHHTFAESDAPGNLLRPVFKDGELLVDEDFETIRRRLHPNF